MVDKISPKEGIIDLSKKGSFFVGEEHGNTGPAELLSEIMPQLKSSGKKYLFLEQFCQNHQHVLDAFSKDKDRESVIKHLRDNGWNKGDTSEQQVTYMNALIDMVDSAQKQGMKVMGIDDPNLQAPEQRHLAN